ncbi:hypothetical protein [Synechococcus sp. CBW1107]|uniref:hypothetical protein n=1 Tax=Synechococcus sp. CBW1107 TaxID=2789857 RepID=UPI002AD2CBF7|nr:hypothetical protein [Synechococcus sp. CBW1107]CAK6698845.1 hypothetical protein ICNINCKA_02521 [Synechococcus sp. CBW1107]
MASNKNRFIHGREIRVPKQSPVSAEELVRWANIISKTDNVNDLVFLMKADSYTWPLKKAQLHALKLNGIN